MKKLFRNRSGMTLVEVMIAAGIMGAIAVGTTKLVGDQQKVATNINRNFDAQEIRNTLTTILSDTKNCMETFDLGAEVAGGHTGNFLIANIGGDEDLKELVPEKDIGSLAVNTGTLITIQDLGSGENYTTDHVMGPKLLLNNSYRGNKYHTTGQNVIVFNYFFTLKKVKQTFDDATVTDNTNEDKTAHGGSGTKYYTIRIAAQHTTAGVITSCRAAGGNANSIWRYSGNGIYHAAGNVLIGAVATNDASLHIEANTTDDILSLRDVNGPVELGFKYNSTTANFGALSYMKNKPTGATAAELAALPSPPYFNFNKPTNFDQGVTIPPGQSLDVDIINVEDTLNVEGKIVSEKTDLAGNLQPIHIASATTFTGVITAVSNIRQYSDRWTITDEGVFTANGNGYFEAASDRRLKKNIRKIKYATEKINALNGVSFKWKKSGKRSYGVIAQNVEKVFPELVGTNKKTGKKSVNYDGLIGPIIQALKEQRRVISKQAEMIQMLQKRVEALED